MKKVVPVVVLFVIMLSIPAIQGPGNEAPESRVPLDMSQGIVVPAADNVGLTGTGTALPVTMTGYVTNTQDGPLEIDSSTEDYATVSLENGWSGTNLQASVDTLSAWMNDQTRNGDLSNYHNEKWLATPHPSEDVAVPDYWELHKVVAGTDNSHPHYGNMKFVDVSDGGYTGDIGWRFEADWSTSDTVAPSSEIYLRQYVPAPYRDVYSAEVSFYYKVSPSSTMVDQAHLIVRVAGYETKLHVFESGDTKGTWLQVTVTIPDSAFSTFSAPGVVQLDVGIATDLSGTPTSQLTSHVLVDNIVLNLRVRPFPEQIDLKANGTLVDGAIEGSLFTYLPDNANRDCYDDSDGIDLDGYFNDGRLSVGIYGSWSVADTFQIGLQFPVNIPRGAAILSAYLEVESAGGSDVVGMRIKAADVANSSAFTSGFPHLEDRYSWLDASIDWVPDSWADGRRYRSSDITPLLQQVVVNESWTENNYVTLMLDYMYTSDNTAYYDIEGSSDYDNTPADDNLPRLVVKYLVPRAQDVVTTLHYKKTLTIDSAKVAATLTDFPVLVDIYDTDLHDPNKVQADGDDIAFMVNGTPVDHEIELFDQNFNSTHAHLVAWVRVPTLSATTDTVLEMYYGNPDSGPLENPAGVWRDGYAGVWHMDGDPSSEMILDSSSSNMDGTPLAMESTDSVAGKIGHALNFDGLNEHVRTGPTPSDSWSAITVSGWVNLDGTGIGRFISKEVGSDGTPIVWMVGHNGTKIHCIITTDGASGAQTEIDAGPALTVGTWHYVVMVWDPTLPSGQLRVYIDGTLYTSADNTGSTFTDSDLDAYLASAPGSRYFNGQLDELRVESTARSANWIQTEYNNQNDPASFLSVGTEETLPDTWSDDSHARLVFSTASSGPVNLDVTLGLDISGSGGSLDQNYNSGTTFYVTNASIVEWTANVLVSPPTGTQSLEVNVEFPQTEWRPTSVTNPIGVEKTYPTEWYYHSGVVTVPASSVDVFGVWVFRFVSLNYVSNVLVGPNGGTLSTTATLNVNDVLAVRATTPWIQGATTNLVLTDPTGNEWYRTSLTTSGTTTHELPSFRYKKTITIPASAVSADMTNYPVLVDIYDADLHSSDKVQPDGDDIVFVQNGVVLSHDLDYFEQNYNSTHAHLVAWVLLNVSSTTDTTFNMYYGNPVVGPQERPEEVWINSYEAVWHLNETAVDEGTAAIHYDATSGDYDGTQNGNAQTSSAAFGYAQEFDGTDDQIVIAASKGLNPTGDVTIAGWFRLDQSFSSGSATSLVLLTKYKDANNNMLIALVGQDYGNAAVPDGSLVFRVENGGQSREVWTSRAFWNTGWYSFTVVLNSNNPASNLIYINGADDTATGTSGQATWANVSYSADWGIGGGTVDTVIPGGNAYFKGTLDEIRISSGARTSSWVSVEYSNQNDPGTFLSVGTESERVSPEHTFTKTIDSTAAAGVWTASVFYNDTGTAVDNKTGLYEREFIVKHDSALSLIAPGDAVPDSIAAAVAGDKLYVEVELTDVINSDKISGATVKMNWSVSGVETNVTLHDYSTGRYGITLNTTDLGTNQRWTLVVYSSHPYYNDDTLTFYLDLTHNTELTYVDVDTTPWGQDFTATLIFRDTYTGQPVTGATITFANGTPANVVAQGNGMYNISVPTGGLSLGDHWYIFNASKSGAYLEDASVNITFTLRAHYTTASVSGDLITPSGWNTPITVTIIDTDTGGTVAVSEVSSISFSWTGGSYSESPPSSYDITLPTNTWPLGTRTVTMAVTMSSADYAAPSNYQFDITIRKHNTTATVTGDFVTPYGFNTTVNVVIYDADNGTTLTASDVSSLTFTSSYSTDVYSSLTSLTIELDTDAWSVGSTGVTLTAVMQGIYDDPDAFTFTVTIRNHYTSASVSGDLLTPYGFNTTVTVVITDTDTGAELTFGDISSYTFVTTHYGSLAGSSSSLTTDLDTDGWSVGVESVTLQVVMSGNYDNPSDYSFSIEIRKHYTSATVTGKLTTPFGNTTTVTVVVTDLDTDSVLAASTVSTVTFAPADYASTQYNAPFSSLEFTLDTSVWSVGTELVTLSVTMTSDYYAPSDYDFNIEIYGLSTYLYHEPNDLIFPNGDAFKLIIRVNISEAGPYYGEMIAGLVQANFTVHNSTYTYPFTLVEIASGRYNLTIDASYFPEGTYTITIEFNPVNQTLQSSVLDVTFQYRPARSELSSPDRAVTTPYQTDYSITLNFTDVDRGQGIAGATITAQGVNISSVVDHGNGQYTVTINATYLTKGEHLYNITADKAGYAAQTLSFKVVVRIVYTSAIPTVGALDIPVGNDPVFYVEYRDIDHDVPITPETPFTIQTNWTHGVSWTYISAEGRYQLTFITELNDPLQQNIVVQFNFSKGENYQFGIFQITVTIRTHHTDLRLVTAVEPTSYKSNITISLFYGDIDDQVGIASEYVSIRVENLTGVVTFYAYNDTALGDGYYLIYVPASQFTAPSVQNLTVFFNWTGPVYSYQNKSILVSAHIVGEESTYTLLTAAEPTPYLGVMSYTFLYAERYSGDGITNSSYGGGHVHIYVVFQGISVDTSQVTISEIDPIGSPGEYSVSFNTTIFNSVGVFYMEIHIEWDKGVQPYYTNRTDTVTVRVISRDTLVSVVPPSPTSYGINATFTFTYEDVTGNTSVPIGYDPAKMTITLNLTDYALTYDSGTKVFTVSFDTSQFGAPLGQRVIQLDVTWAGTPFYSNQTGRLVVVTVTARQTLLDYQSPAPTQYNDNVTFTVTWTDVTEASSSGISGATVTLYDGATPIPSSYYSVTENAGGEYVVELTTTYYSAPGVYQVTVNVTATQFYYLSEEATRNFEVRYRLTILSAEPPARVPYNGTLEVILNFQDLYTLAHIGNSTGDVTLDVISPSNAIYTITWDSGLSRYVLHVETYNLGLTINTVYTLHLNFSYAYKAPFYGWDDVYVQYEVRPRYSSLELSISPVPTPYNEFANFTLQYRDTDFSGTIDGGILTVYKGGTPLSQGTEYLVSPLGSGLYQVSINASALNGLGATQVTVWANWTGGVPYYGNASITLDITVTHRPTSLEVVSPPGQTRYQENVTFIISLVDLRSDSSVDITKNMVTVYNEGTPLTTADFSMSRQGTTNDFEISIDSTVISATLVSNRNITVLVNYPEVVPYYADDSTSVRVSIIRRDTFLSLNRPANTAYGENATLTFTYLDTTGTTSVPIEDSSQLDVVTSLSLTPRIVYDSVSKSFSIYFNTSQFGGVGEVSFYLNVTWAGTPYYANQTQVQITLTVVNRQTQVDFPAPPPVPFGDNVTFTVSYLDVAGSSPVGIPDFTFELYYGGSPLTGYYDYVHDGQGTLTITLNTTFLTSPGVYSLNASFVYAGTYYRADAYAVRDLQLRYRTTLLSAEPVGSVGYGTPLEIVLYFQDMLTLDNIGTSTTLTILTDTGVPWVYNITWRPTYQNYLLVVETQGQPLSVGQTYTLHVNMSYANIEPYYYWDDTFIEYSIRNRTSVLDVMEAPLPTSYLEYSPIKVYYRDVDGGSGISGATFSLVTSGSSISSTYYYYQEVSTGVYVVYLNTSALGGLGSYLVTVRANWPGGAPYHDDAARNVTFSVVERTTNVEIVSPPSATQFLDNVTFTFSYTDTIRRSPIDIQASNVILYGNGTQLSSADFAMRKVGSIFEVSINSTVLSSHLVTDYNLTIKVDWNAGTPPYYADDVTTLRLSTKGRTMTVEVGPIETTPLGDNMTIVFSVLDEGHGTPVGNAIILFDCVEQPLQEGSSYWVYPGTGADVGQYTVKVSTAALLTTGDFHFLLTVHWNPSASPFYANKTTMTLIGSVDLIWAVLTSDLPTPSSVQISQDVYVLVYYTDLDHGSIGVDGASLTVTYLSTGKVPTNLQITPAGTGVYNVSFSTIDITTTGSWTLNITAEKWPYTASSVQPTFTVKVIDTALSAPTTSIQANWTDTVRVYVDYEDLLHGNLTTGATVWCTWGGQTVYFTESAVLGRYYADLDTSLEDAGTRVVTVTASKTQYASAVTTVSLVVLTLPSSIVPIEPAGLVLSTYRGEGANITIYLNNTYSNAPVGNIYVQEITGTFEGNGITYTFVYNGTPGFYKAYMPGSDTSDVNTGFYYFRITAKMRNFNPASYQFTIELQQTRTQLILDEESGTTQEMTLFYSETVRLTVVFTELFNESALLTSATVTWYITDIEVNGTMVEDPLRPGYYYYDLNTSTIGYGIWAITIRARPADPQFSNAVTALTLTVKRIPTVVYGPNPLTRPWGWTGNLSFTYWDEVFDRPIVGANARYSWGPYTGVEAIDLGNGTYLVPVDTTVLLPEIKWSITISFSKANYIESNGAVQLTLELIETEVQVYAPEQNIVEDSSRNLIVPMGDYVNVTIYYGDVEMYIGGIEGATLTPESELRGDTFSGGHPIEIIELGGGYYSFIFDTNDLTLYEYSEGVPVTGQTYRAIIGLHLDNRTEQEIVIRIRIVDIPTSFVASLTSPSVSLVHGDAVTIDLFYNDTWHGRGVTADFIEAVSNNEAVLQVAVAPGDGTGHYTVTLNGVGVGTAIVRINLGRQYYANVSLTYAIEVVPNDTDVLVQRATTYGLPLSLFLLVLVILYVKVWSVPKRVRQINGQIRALRRGKVPKPVSDAKSRQELLASLFNDTYSELGITREPEQLPPESVKVDIPEMGELLMQLSILTNLSPEELDEFKSDISKMKLSEQAAFVKEVINQEAMRAARREGKTMEEVLQEIEKIAKARLGRGAPAAYGRPEEAVGEALILGREMKEERPVPEVEALGTRPEPTEIAAPSIEAEEARPPVTDRLSPFELEELKRKLEARGVPPHEIDTIIDQAKNLPRELVDELIRSLIDNDSS